MAFTPASAKSIASELLDRLDAVAGGRVPESDLRQIAFSAQRLKNADFGDYLMVMGLIAALERDVSAFRDFFGQTFEMFGYESHRVQNAALALFELGLYGEGLDLLRSAVKTNIAIGPLTFAFDHFAFFGRYNEAHELAIVLERMNKSYALDLLNGANVRFQEIGISEDDLQAAAVELRNFLAEKGYSRLMSDVAYDNGPEFGTALVLRVALPGSPQQVFDIEQESNVRMTSVGLKAVEQGAFAWYFVPNEEAPRARRLA